MNTKYANEQLVLQTFIANGLVPKGNVDFATSIAQAKFPSEKQMFFIKKFIDEIQNPPKSDKIAAKSIFDMFDTAMKHLKYPKFSLKTEAGNDIRFSMNKKTPDVIYMNRSGFGSDFYGKIFRGEGKVDLAAAGRIIHDDLMKFLEEFCQKPIAYVAEFGKTTRNCCFCSKTLDTPESLAAGYGPICANHYGLPWGKTAAGVTLPGLTEIAIETSKSMEDNIEDAYHAEMFTLEREEF
jgi:hypothetical protein